mmetsp:Transcript_57108/g.124093  ORF Transcript_57108/g.124093 Transcript_57108/m.124093 type:complete len:543 (-) Transcript_57108:134-1762(-)
MEVGQSISALELKRAALQQRDGDASAEESVESAKGAKSKWAGLRSRRAALEHFKATEPVWVSPVPISFVPVQDRFSILSYVFPDLLESPVEEPSIELETPLITRSAPIVATLPPPRKPPRTQRPQSARSHTYAKPTIASSLARAQPSTAQVWRQSCHAYATPTDQADDAAAPSNTAPLDDQAGSTNETSTHAVLEDTEVTPRAVRWAVSGAVPGAVPGVAPETSPSSSLECAAMRPFSASARPASSPDCESAPVSPRLPSRPDTARASTQRHAHSNAASSAWSTRPLTNALENLPASGPSSKLSSTQTPAVASPSALSHPLSPPRALSPPHTAAMVNLSARRSPPSLPQSAPQQRSRRPSRPFSEPPTPLRPSQQAMHKTQHHTPCHSSGGTLFQVTHAAPYQTQHQIPQVPQAKVAYQGTPRPPPRVPHSAWCYHKPLTSPRKRPASATSRCTQRRTWAYGDASNNRAKIRAEFGAKTELAGSSAGSSAAVGAKPRGTDALAIERHNIRALRASQSRPRSTTLEAVGRRTMRVSLVAAPTL